MWLFRNGPIWDGKANHKVIFFESDQMIISGAGEIDLDEGTLNFILAPRPNKRRWFSTDLNINVKGSVLEPELSLNKASATTSFVTKYGAFTTLGPAGLLLPFQRGAGGDHACVQSISEFQE